VSSTERGALTTGEGAFGPEHRPRLVAAVNLGLRCRVEVAAFASLAVVNAVLIHSMGQHAPATGTPAWGERAC
jgi:hypothetical protein